MINDFNSKLNDYLANWNKLISDRQNKPFFQELKPVAIGWKVADLTEYRRLYDELRDQCDRIVETWMNGRWIAKMHLKDDKLEGSIEIIKLMQRRPGSDDALGLDHVDFYSPAVSGAEAVLKQEKDLKWTHESNDVVDNYAWISVWFEGGEAKLKNGTVVDIVIEELKQISDHIKS